MKSLLLKGQIALMMNLQTASAASNFNKTMENLVDWADEFCWGVFLISALIIGFMFMAGEKSREKAKAWLPWVILGAIIVIGSTQFAKGVYNNIAF